MISNAECAIADGIHFGHGWSDDANIRPQSPSSSEENENK